MCLFTLPPPYGAVCCFFTRPPLPFVPSWRFGAPLIDRRCLSCPLINATKNEQQDASDHFREGEGSLLPLWRFSTDRTKRKQVWYNDGTAVGTHRPTAEESELFLGCRKRPN